jgi:hypothetical protein
MRGGIGRAILCQLLVTFMFYASDDVLFRVEMVDGLADATSDGSFSGSALFFVREFAMCVRNHA